MCRRGSAGKGLDGRMGSVLWGLVFVFVVLGTGKQCLALGSFLIRVEDIGGWFPSLGT